MESIAMTAMNFIQPMRALIIRVNTRVCALECFPFNTSPSSLPFAPLTCQPSVSGVFPNNIQGSGGGVSDVIAKGPPERGSQGPSHHVGLGVPHPGAMDFSAAPAPRPCWPPPTADCPWPAAGWGSAGRRGCVSAGPGGASRERALRPQDPGIAARTAAREAPTAGGLLDGRQARAAATSGKAYK